MEIKYEKSKYIIFINTVYQNSKFKIKFKLRWMNITMILKLYKRNMFVHIYAVYQDLKFNSN